MKPSVGLSIAALVLPGIAFAQFDLQRLIELQSSASAQSAYAYAEQYRAEQEGDPDFDYYYGIAAIDSGRASTGVFALERVLALQPENHAARLELARGYFILEEYARSRAEFEAVRKLNPPAAVGARIDRFLDAIRLKEGRYRTTASAFAELALGNDTNVNSAPEDAQLSSGVVLDADSVETGDSFSELTAGGQFNMPLAPGRSVFAMLSASGRSHTQEDQFNNQTVTAQAGGIVLKGQQRYQADLQYQTYAFDGETFRNLAALDFEWRLRASERNQFSLFGQYATLDYPDQDIRNSRLLIAGAGYTTQIATRLSPVGFASLYAGTEDPDDGSIDAARVAERSLVGLRIGSQLTLTPQTTLGVSLSAQHSAYAEADALEGEKREDNYTSLSLDGAWLLGRRYSAHLRLSYTDNSSNIEVSDYQRAQATVSVRAELY